MPLPDQHALTEMLIVNAMRNQNWDLVIELAEMGKAEQVPASEFLTWDELGEALGVAKEKNGRFKTEKLMNACLRVSEIPSLKALPSEQRIRVYASAVAALEHFSSRHF